MKEVINYIVLFLLCSFAAGAQSLPSFKQSPAITTGRLDNGTAYYIVTNNASKGYADFALVQKNHINRDGSRKLLSSLGSLSDRLPYKILASKGVKCPREGFFYEDGRSTVFSFRNVPVFDQSASDSTLLVLVSMIHECPVPQAVIVSGDIKTSSILDRLGVLSLTVPRLQQEKDTPPYAWKSAPAEFRCSELKGGNMAEISVTFRTPRTPAGQMGTAQPLVTSMFASELEILVRKRVRQAFRDAGIPLASVNTSYSNSSAGPGDESYTFSIVTDVLMLDEAVELFSSILGGMGSRGVGEEEFLYAKNRLILNSQRAGSKLSVPNSEYVRKCIAAYLYGASLAEDSAFTEFFLKRNLEPGKETALFNNYVSAILNPNDGLSVTFKAPARALDDSLEARFSSSWKKAASDSSGVKVRSFAADTSSFAMPGSKVKLKTDTADPVTGGRLWTFSNGIKVVYKKLPTKGRFHYSLVIRGGSVLVPGLAEGENAFVGDMLALCSVAGLDAASFRAVLRDNGITMDCEVSSADLRIHGSAPSDRVQLLLKSLLSIAGARTPDSDAFAYYRRSEALRLEKLRSSEDIYFPYLDSLRRPFYKALSIRNALCLTDGIPAKADKYFSSQFSRVNDGVLVLVGDLASDKLQKQLCRCLGGFRTSRSYAARPRMGTAYRDGWYSVTMDRMSIGSGHDGVGTVMSAMMPFTMDGYMTFRVACLALERAVTEAMAPYGLTVDVRGNAEFFPTEQYSVSVFCSPASPDGLPEGVVTPSARDVQNILRRALLSASRSPLNSTTLQGYKAELTNRISSSLDDPEQLLEISAVRYSLGKDMVTGYQNHVKSVTDDGVRRMLRALDDGSKTELILR